MSTKLSIDRKQLAEAVSAIAPLCKKSSHKEVLKYLRFDATGTVQVFATNLSQGASRTLPADIISGGKFLVEAQLLQRFLACCAEETIHILAEGDSVLITSARSKLKTNTPKVAEYPAEFQPTGDIEFTAGASLRALFSPIAMAARGPEERSARYAFDTICLSITGGTIWAVCTDGAKMALAPIQDQPGDSREILIPLEAIRIIESQWKLSDKVQVVVSQNAIYFNSDTWSAYSRLVEGRYPRWQRPVDALGDPLFEATVDFAGLKRVVDTAIIGMADDNREASVTANQGSITLQVGKAPNECESFLPCSGKGESAMHVRIDYLQSAVASFAGHESVEFSICGQPGSKKLVLYNSSHKFFIMGLHDDR